MTSFVASVFSIVHLILRSVLATFSVSVLIVSVRLITARFNVVELLENDLVWIVEKLSFQGLTVVESLTTTTSSSSSSPNGDNALWYAFLYGELTLSALVPLGVHGLLTSTRQCDYVTSSVSTYVMLAVVLGLFLAHRCMDGAIKAEQQKYLSEDDDFMTPFEKMVGRNKLLVMAILSFILSYILILGDKAAALSPEGTNASTRSNRTTPPNKQDDGVAVYYTYQFVRTLVKLSGVFNVVVACMVLCMAMYSSGPADLIPQLKFQDYDLEATFGKDTVYSNEFFYVIQCTMLSTILQTLFIGLATTFSHIAGETTSEALNCGVAGVPLIIVANVITIAIYGDDFKPGTDCMVAHIYMLASTNCYTPCVWWIHRVWKNSNYNPYLRIEAQLTSQHTEDEDKKEKTS